MNAEEKTRYFQELPLTLQREGFAVKPETEEGLLPVELDGQRLCLARTSRRCGQLHRGRNHGTASSPAQLGGHVRQRFSRGKENDSVLCHEGCYADP